MAVPPLLVFNRYTGRVETEAVYGEAWVRWTYGTIPGRLAFHLLVKRALFSRWYGWRMDRPRSRAKIGPFVRTYGIEPSEFAEPLESFRTFNEFFFRRLRAGVRPVDDTPGALVFPADGRHLGFEHLSETDAFYLKGQTFDLRSFLRDDDLVARYRGGPAVFSRLCPVDCHRFHFPVAGLSSFPCRVDGTLASVNPIALRRRLAYLWENRRWLCEIVLSGGRRVLMAEIGATNVGCTAYTFDPGRPVARGEEKGFFRFGGSAVLTLFEPGCATLSPDLLQSSLRQQELYAHLGDVMGGLT